MRNRLVSNMSVCFEVYIFPDLNRSSCFFLSMFFVLFVSGKWYTENTKCLAVYPFTSPVVDVIIDNFVVHAITENGIETFSSRIGHKLFSSYFEYPMITDPYPNEVSHELTLFKMVERNETRKIKQMKLMVLTSLFSPGNG